MQKDIEAFKITVNGKTLDYRVGKELALDNVRAFFEKKYTVHNIWSGGSGLVIFKKVLPFSFFRLWGFCPAH